MNVLIAIGAFLVAIGVLVTVHEFGHFIVARALGVKVLRFSIGFGKPIFRWCPGGETEYVIAALPLGGYVKPLDEREGPVDPSERKRALNRQPAASRAAILFAGPGFNLLFALLAYWVVFLVGIPGIKPVLGTITAGSPASRAGLVSRQTIRAVNGESVATWEAARLAMLDGVLSNRPISLVVQSKAGLKKTAILRYKNARSLIQPGKLFSGLGISPWYPPLAPVVGKLIRGMPADAAGLRPGERIMSINGNRITTWGQLRKYIEAHPDANVTMTVEKNNGQVVQVVARTTHQKVDGKSVGFIGAMAQRPKNYGESLRAKMQLGPWAAARSAVLRTGQVITMTALMFYRMIVGQASLSNLSGPISIAHYAGAWAQAGVVPFLFFLALISVSLGIFNLLPIPLLDGGQLSFLVVELFRRKPLSEHAEAIAQQIGIGLVVLLVGFTVVNDISHLLHS